MKRAGVPYGSFTETDDEEAYGKAGRYGKPLERPFPLTGALTGRPPYGKAPYGAYGQTALREAFRGGTVLTGRAGPYGKGGGPLRGRTTKKAGPLREAPYGEERSLREGPVLTGLGPFIEKNDL